jgi:membrane-associated protein
LGRRPLKGNAAVRRTIEMLEHYGGPAVFLGRFVAFARALIPGLAGMSGLRYRVFLFYNAIGGLIWGVGYTLLGYVVGVSFEHILSEVGLWSLAAVAAAIAIAIGVRQLARRRRRRQLAVALSDMGGGAGATGLATTDPASAPTVEAEAGASGRTSADPES